LINHKADIHALSHTRWTPLHWAGNEGHIGITTALLEAGALDQIQNQHGELALHLAAQKDHEAVVQLLIQRGSDPHLTDNKLRTVFHYAAEQGHEETVIMLLSMKIRPDTRDIDGRTPLYYAILHGHVTITKILLDLGSVVDETVKEAFLEAAEAGHELIVQFLIEHGVDLSFRDSSGYTVLHRAVLGSQLEILELLLDTEADRSARDNEGKTALHLAAEQGEDEIAKVLSGISKLKNLQDGSGWTALHWAVVNEDVITVRILLDADVDPNVLSFEKCTALDLAESGPLEEIEQMLREALSARD